MKYWLRVGVQVSARASEVSSETVIVTASARKNTPVTPVMAISGMKTTTGVMVEPISGTVISFSALWMASSRALARVAMQDDVFDDDDRIVDHQSDGRGETAERHQVEGLRPSASAR